MDSEENTHQNVTGQLIAMIAQHGHAVVSVMGPVVYSYSVGLTTDLGFELLTFGLQGEHATIMLNAMATQLRKATISDGIDVHRIANTPLRLQTVTTEDDSHLLQKFNAIRAMGFAPTSIRIVQWPDVDGRFPGHPLYSSLVSQTLSDISHDHASH